MLDLLGRAEGGLVAARQLHELCLQPGHTAGRLHDEKSTPVLRLSQGEAVWGRYRQKKERKEGGRSGVLRLRKHPAHGGVGVAKVGHGAGADHLRRGRVRWRRCRRPRRHDLDGCTGRMGAHGDAHRGAHGGLHGRVLPARWRRTKSNVAWEWKTTAPPSVVTSLVTSLVPFLVVPSVVPFLVAAFVAAFVAAGCLGPSSNLSCRIHKCGLPCRLGWRVVLQLQAVGHGGQRPAHGAVGRGMAEPDASMRAPSARQRRLGRVCGPAALPALCALRKPPRPRLPGRE